MNKFILVFAAFIFSTCQIRSQTVLNSQNFSGGLPSAGWKTVDKSGTGAGHWTYNHNPISLTNYLPENFNSTTASNGFATIISDGNPNALNTDLLSPSIDCSNSNYVALQFEYVMGLVTPYPTAQVFVSTDQTNWYMVFDALNNANGSNPQLVQIDISNYAALQSTVYIKFNYQATANVLWAVDDISVISLPSDNASVYSIDGPAYTPITNSYPVQCTIQNLGGPLSSITVNYSIDGNPPVSEQINSLGLSAFQTRSYTFNATAPVLTAGQHTITVFTSAPNGDVSSPNDTLSRTVSFFDHLTDKNVLIEEFATAPCGYCPGGALYLKNVLEAEGAYVIAATHHAGYKTDSMTVEPDDITLTNAFTPPGGGAPEAAIDRVVFAGEPAVCVGVPNLAYIDQINPWDSLVELRRPYFAPLSVSASNTYDVSTRKLDITVSATVYGVLSGDFRVNCYIIEDSIPSNATGYAQVCYYYSSPSDQSINPYYNNCTYSSATNEYYANGYMHNHVVREYMGGTWGNPGIIPATTSTDSTYTVQYSTTLNGRWNANHVSLVAFVNRYNADYTSGLNEVMNVVSMPLNGSGVNRSTQVIVSGLSDITNTPNGISIYPNPSNDFAYLRYNLDQDTRISFDVYNSLGQTVYSSPETNATRGAAASYINTEKYASGLYLVAFKQQGKVMQTLKFVVAR